MVIGGKCIAKVGAAAGIHLRHVGAETARREPRAVLVGYRTRCAVVVWAISRVVVGAADVSARTAETSRFPTGHRTAVWDGIVARKGQV